MYIYPVYTNTGEGFVVFSLVFGFGTRRIWFTAMCTIACFNTAFVDLKSIRIPHRPAS